MRGYVVVCNFAFIFWKKFVISGKILLPLLHSKSLWLLFISKETWFDISWSFLTKDDNSYKKIQNFWRQNNTYHPSYKNEFYHNKASKNTFLTNKIPHYFQFIVRWNTLYIVDIFIACGRRPWKKVKSYNKIYPEGIYQLLMSKRFLCPASKNKHNLLFFSRSLSPNQRLLWV